MAPCARPRSYEVYCAPKRPGNRANPGLSALIAEACSRSVSRPLPPEAATSFHLVRNGPAYTCRRLARTPYGIAWTFALDVAPPHPFAQVARVERFASQLEVSVAEIGGWLRKEVRSRVHHLERLFVTEMTFTSAAALLRLRSSLDEGAAGFDVLYAEDGAKVEVVRAGAQGEPGDTTLPADEDAAKLLALRAKLLELALQIPRAEGRVVEATLDERSIRELRDPGIIVDRLVAAMAPTVSEIALRSVSETELVLKRLLGDSRREEIFVSKAELREKLAPLPGALRAYFAPLGLSGVGGRASSIPDAPAGAEGAGTGGVERGL